MSILLIELQFAPPVHFFTKFLLHEQVRIDQHEHYHKGSYRNRCYIAGPNGPQRLSLPLQQGKNQQQPIRDVQLAYKEPWQQQHWRAIETAYNRSPFFEFYADELRPFFQRKYQFLFDLNWELLQCLLKWTHLPPNLGTTLTYAREPEAGVVDFRDQIHPKNRDTATDPSFHPSPYLQVFQEKNGFLPNMSMLDLLFCCGPQSILELKRSIVHP